MPSGLELNLEDFGLPSSLEAKVLTAQVEMSNCTSMGEAKVSYSNLLEFAADNDLKGFKEYIGCNPGAVDDIGLWYGRQVGSSLMVLEYRTPLMVAAMYGSVDVVKIIISYSEADINRTCSPDGTTALHCAASGGSINAVDIIKLLLLAGANPDVADAKGLRPFDVINVARALPALRPLLEDLLSCDGSCPQSDPWVSVDEIKTSSLSVLVNFDGKLLSSSSEAPSSPMTSNKFNEGNVSSVSEKKEYPIDPSIPDIKNSIYSTDEFRMYSFKVRPCSRAYSHDWTECPFVHPGENARRRDPRKFHYSCVPCPDFRKGSCKRGDLCEYAHGVFECWLHPAQYRTRLCKDGINCARRVCFFAHTPEELRPLYMSTGSSMVSSPHSAASAAAIMDMAAALNIFPGSPSTVAVVSPFGFTPPPMSPSNVMSHSSSPWPQQSIPTLHLPGSNIQNNNLQMSRLRSSLNARDLQADELSMLHDLEMEQKQILNDVHCFPHPHFNSPGSNLSVRSKSLTPSNLDDLFSAEISSSPRYSDQVASPMFSPSHKTAVLNHFQQQQSMLSPINTKVFSPKGADHPLLQPSFGGPSSPGGVMSPRGIESPHSPLSARLSVLALREKQHQQLRSLSSRELGANLPHDLVGADNGSPVSSWPNKWESANGKPDWSVNGDELGRLKRSYTAGHSKGEEPDVSWVHSLVKDSPTKDNDGSSRSFSRTKGAGEGSNSNLQPESMDHTALSAWLDQLQLDQIVA